VTADGAVDRLVRRALRPAVGDPVPFLARARVTPPAPAGSRPNPSGEAPAFGPAPDATRDGPDLAERVPHAEGPAIASSADRPTLPSPVREGRRRPAVAVPQDAAAPVIGTPVTSVGSGAERPHVTEPRRSVPAPPGASTPAAEVRPADVAPVRAEPSPDSTLARALAWLSEPTPPAGPGHPDPVPAEPSEPVAGVTPARPAPAPTRLTPAPRPVAPPVPPTVVIDRIEIVTAARGTPAADPLASLAERRRGASRHARPR
jgi:hypothetical protein